MCLLCLAACGGAQPPDVILISIDTLRRDALAAYDAGARPLANLDRFAAESVRYENALSSASWTLPAHASLLTGLYPDRHGATDRRVTLAGDVTTLAEVFAERGYETVAFTGGGFLDAKYGLGRGFARYEAEAHEKQGSFETATGLLSRVKGYLATRTSRRPLFLFLHTYAVHNYYDVRDEAVARAGRGALAARKQYRDCVLGRESCPDKSWEDLRALYRAELELMDGAFGELRGELERAGSWDQAFVVVLSDHGEGFEPARARIHHGGRLHADQLRIPLLVHGPGLAARSESGPVSITDVMPTLLDLVGVSAPAELDGRSFATNLRTGSAVAARPLFAMEHYFDWQGGKRETSAEVVALPLELAVIEGGRWYITGSHPDELYEAGDVAQQENRMQSAAQAAGFRSRLGSRPFVRPETAPAADDEQLGRDLDALGYGGRK